MKKKLMIIYIIGILLFPCTVEAAMFNNFNITKNYLHNYANELQDSNIYIVKNTNNFVYSNGIISSNVNYKNAGLLNLDEFIISKNEKGDSYLYNGLEYWTMTESTETDVYAIDGSENKYSLLNKSTAKSGLRPTVYINNAIEITGKGTYEDPWKMGVPSYKVIFNVNGGNAFTGETCQAPYNIYGSECSKKVTYYKAYGDLPIPTRDNYDFIGWYTEENDGNKVDSNSIFSISSDQTLYAHWKDKTPPLITLKSNSNTTYAKIQDIVVEVSDANGIKPGQTLKYGWSTTNTIAPTTFTNVTLSNTTEAKTVSFNVRGTGITGEYYLWVLPVSLEDVSNNIQKNNTISTGKFYFDNEGPSCNVSVVGGANSLKITITANDTRSGMPTTQQYGFKYGSQTSYTMGSNKEYTFYPNSGTYYGYGYVIDKLGNPSYCTSATPVAVSTNVIFNVNGGDAFTTSTCGTGLNLSGNMCYKSVTLNSTYGVLPTATKSGSTFKGWYTEANGETKVTSNTQVTNGAQHTLYAHYNSTLSDEVVDNPKSDANINFARGSQAPGDLGIYYTADAEKYGEDGTRIYYFRGNVQNNYVSFAKAYWRIMRTTSEGGIKLIYAGGNPSVGSSSLTNTSGYISTSQTKYNSNAANKYNVGYTFNSSSYSGTQSNSVVKNAIDTWYKSKLASYASYLSTTAIFCNDRSFEYKNQFNFSFYGGWYRTVAPDNDIYPNVNRHPTFKCPSTNNSRYTASKTTGNGFLTLPIALPTADETIYGGNIPVEGSTSRGYLTNNASQYSWWTMTPSNASELKNGGGTFMIIAGVSGGTTVEAVDMRYSQGYGSRVRPVIAMKPCVKVSGGNGLVDTPYTLTDSSCK